VSLWCCCVTILNAASVSAAVAPQPHSFPLLGPAPLQALFTGAPYGCGCSTCHPFAPLVLRAVATTAASPRCCLCDRCRAAREASLHHKGPPVDGVLLPLSQQYKWLASESDQLLQPFACCDVSWWSCKDHSSALGALRGHSGHFPSQARAEWHFCKPFKPRSPSSVSIRTS
jgi:hypothetical protein